MILEIAQFEIKPELTAEFEANVARAKPLFARARGCHGMSLHRSSEFPARYRLFVYWDTLENHTADFRESEDFKAWRALVGHCFASPPQVEHVAEAWSGFRQ